MDPMCQMLVVPGWFLFRIQSWTEQRVMVVERNDFGICTGGNRFFISMGARALSRYSIGSLATAATPAETVTMAMAEPERDPRQVGEHTPLTRVGYSVIARSLRTLKK